jgi:SAM-dependent methyltransferase
MKDRDPIEHQHPYDIPYHWAIGPFYQYVNRLGAQRVAPVMRDRSVLEMGCGDGYITAQIAKVARQVFGFDTNERAIAFAEMIVREPNVGFGIGRAQDVVDVASEMEGDVEVVASFEVVEHLSEAEREAFLAGARRVLAPRGKLVLTTPNGAKRPGHRMNPHHEHEFTAPELRGLLATSGFTNIRIEGLYLQPPWPQWLEHVADTVPFRALFYRLARAGASHPDACRTLVCVCESA